MPFLLGYFGKKDMRDPVRSVAEQQAHKDSLKVIQQGQLVVAVGFYEREKDFSDRILAGKAEFFIGKLFSRDTYQPIISLDDQAINTPEDVMKRCWGRYAGVLFDDKNQKITLVRDPIGLQPFFYSITPDGIMFASEVALLYDGLDTKPDYDWNYFAEYIAASQHALTATPFKGITELPAAYALEYDLDGNQDCKLVWDIVPSTPITHDPLEQQEELLHTLRESMRAWVADSKGVCVELSGGLDSSSVMIMLREVLRPDQKLIAVNYIDSKITSANEVQYAQEVADMCGAPLYFIDAQQASFTQRSYQQNWRPNRPTSLRLFNNYDAQLERLMQEHGCTDILSGQGGDHVFSAPPVNTALADYWLEKGLRGSMHVAHNLSSYNRMPLSKLLYDNIGAVKKYYTSGLQAQKKSNTTWMSDEFLQHFKPTPNPWHAVGKNLYPGKREHVGAIPHAIFYSDRNQRLAHRLFTHPLLSQPVVECALQIPTYEAFNDTFDRIVLRNAVSSIKKPTALWRVHKGNTTASMLDKLNMERDGICRMIQEGPFGKSGLIKPEWLEMTMTSIRHGNADSLWPVVLMITVQHWFDQWSVK